jgi:hypothetical protein
MNRMLKAFCFTGASLSLMMCNLEEVPEEGESLVEQSQEAAQAPVPPPCLPMSTQLTSGVNDNFAAGPAEVPAPRAAVVAWINSVYSVPGVRNYDAAHGNQYFAHSFMVAPPTPQHVLNGAVLVGRLQCRGGNDALYVGFLNAVTGLPPAPYWGGALTAAPFSSACNLTAAPTIFGVNLASTPNTAQNLIPTMTANGFLDVLMQDDSQMDFLQLRLDWRCLGTPLP